MLDDIGETLESYDQNWQKLVASLNNQAFFQALIPVALGWKVADFNEYKRCYDQLREVSDLATEVWMNGRWIAKFHLKDRTLGNNIQLIKVLQRRPYANDQLGLDHLDFYYPQPMSEAAQILAAEPDLKWTVENNDIVSGYQWHSVWFDGTEAKLRDATVLDVLQTELRQLNDTIRPAGNTTTA